MKLSIALLLLTSPIFAQIVNPGGGGGGTGTVTSVATTGPITGGPITTTGTIACATCATTDTTQTISGAKTVSSALTLGNDLLVADSQYVRDTSGGQIQFLNPSSGTTMIINQGGPFSATSGNIAPTQINSSYAPASGTGIFTPLSVNATINGTSTGKAYGMVVSTSTNVFTGGTIHIFSAGTATGNQLTGYTEKAYITTAGDIGGNSFINSAGFTGTVTIAAGTMVIPVTALAANTCDASATTATATGAASTDTAGNPGWASDPTGVTGYGGGTNGGISFRLWVTTNTLNLKRCNESGSSITPGAMSINWRIVR